MRVGVWGAGNLGVPLVRRLLSAPWASEVHWTTRDHAQLQPHIWDLEHGLALSVLSSHRGAPTAHATVHRCAGDHGGPGISAIVVCTEHAAECGEIAEQGARLIDVLHEAPQLAKRVLDGAVNRRPSTR